MGKGELYPSGDGRATGKVSDEAGVKRLAVECRSPGTLNREDLKPVQNRCTGLAELTLF